MRDVTFPEMMKPELCAALVAAQRAARAVEKNAENKFHKYRYVSADAMIAEGREALGEAGLALLCAGWRFDATQSAGGAVGRVVVDYQLVHTSGAAMAWQSSGFVIPEKGRPDDKAEMGALTENLSYTIRGLLMLPRVDESASVETRQDASYEPRRGPAPVAAARAAEPASRPAAAATGDAAHAALAAQFKADVAQLTALSAFGPLAEAVDAAKLPPALLADVRAEIAVYGLKFAAEAADLDWWVEKLSTWALPKNGEPYARAAEAFDAAESRIERDAIQDAGKAAA